METRLAGVTGTSSSRGARGRLMLGDASILFQEIATPAGAPRPQLPASIRGTLARPHRSPARRDHRRARCSRTSASPPTRGPPTSTPRRSACRRVAANYHQDTIDDHRPRRAAGDRRPGTAAPVAPRQTPRADRPPDARHRLAPARAARRRRAAHGLDPHRANETPRGPGAMHERQPGADLDKQLEDATPPHGRDRQHRPHVAHRRPRALRRHAPTDPLVDDPTLTRIDPTHRIERPSDPDHAGRSRRPTSRRR